MSGFDDPAYQRLKEEILGKQNGKASTSNGGPPVEEPQLPAISVADWTAKIRSSIENALFEAPEEARRVTASHARVKPDEVLDHLVTLGRDAAKFLPAPELSESAMEEEYNRIAEHLLKLLDKHFPAGVGAQLPANLEDLRVTYADRLPVEATTEWARITTEPREYATGGLIRISSDAAISGLMGAGKTTLMANLVRGWATGQPVLDRPSIKAKVLVVASPKEFENWLETISLWGLVGQVFVIESIKAHDKTPEAQAQWFDAVMQIYGCRAYALDTLFDFYGTPPSHSADQNRLVMNEQAPLLQIVRERSYWGVVGGHQTKAEAKSDTPRDPEEAFAGHTGWMAQHRMRISLRRKGGNAIAIITGKGGYGDQGILEEQLLSYEDATRTVRLDGPFAKHLGKAALPVVLETLRAIGKWTVIDKLCKEIGRGEKFVRPGLKEGIAQGLIKDNGRRTRGKAFAPADWTPEEEQVDLFVDKEN